MILFSVITSLLSLIFALVLIYFIRRYPAGTGKQLLIWQALKEGSRAYLKRQNYTVSFVAAALVIILWLVFNLSTAVGFLVGAVASALAGYFGMMTAVDTNVRTTEAAKQGLARAFRVSFPTIRQRAHGAPQTSRAARSAAHIA